MFTFKVGVSRALSALRPMVDTTEIENIINIGLNPGHDVNLNTLKNLNRRKRYKFSKILKDLTRNRNFGINVAKNLFPPTKLKRDKKIDKETSNTVPTGQNPQTAATDNGPNLAWID